MWIRPCIWIGGRDKFCRRCRFRPKEFPSGQFWYCVLFSGMLGKKASTQVVKDSRCRVKRCYACIDQEREESIDD